MDELYKQLPATIEQAAKSPLGLLALIVVALAAIGLVFFRQASEKVRVQMFLLMLIGFAIFGVTAIWTAGPGESSEAAETVAVSGEWIGTVVYGWSDQRYDERFEFQTQGNTLTGTAGFLGVGRTIQDATIGGNQIAFVTRTSSLEGNESVHRYTGVMEDANTIAFVVQTEGPDANATSSFTAHRVSR